MTAGLATTHPGMRLHSPNVRPAGHPQGDHGRRGGAHRTPPLGRRASPQDHALDCRRYPRCGSDPLEKHARDSMQLRFLAGLRRQTPIAWHRGDRGSNPWPSGIRRQGPAALDGGSCGRRRVDDHPGESAAWLSSLRRQSDRFGPERADVLLVDHLAGHPERRSAGVQIARRELVLVDRHDPDVLALLLALNQPALGVFSARRRQSVAVGPL